MDGHVLYWLRNLACTWNRGRGLPTIDEEVVDYISVQTCDIDEIDTNILVASSRWECDKNDIFSALHSWTQSSEELFKNFRNPAINTKK